MKQHLNLAAINLAKQIKKEKRGDIQYQSILGNFINITFEKLK